MCVGGWRVRSLIRKLKIPNFIQKREKLNFALSNEQPPLTLTEIADIWFYSRQGVKWNWVSRCLVPDFTSHLLLQSTLSQVTGITVIKMTSAADSREPLSLCPCDCIIVSVSQLSPAPELSPDWHWLSLMSWHWPVQWPGGADWGRTPESYPGWPRGLGTLFTRPCHNT